MVYAADLRLTHLLCKHWQMAPESFGREFLEWFRDATETEWRTHAPRDHFAASVGGLDWQEGTRWRGGMTSEQIRAAESRFGLTFPPDYRLFLETLHTPDPPMVGARFEGSQLVPHSERQFPDWTGDPGAIEARMAWPLEGLLWSIEADESWYRTWGPRPDTKAEREAVVRQLAAAGPQLIPVFAHRCLVGSETAGSPVLSLYGSDVIFYGPDLRSYLLVEFHFLDRETAFAGAGALEPIPFWQDVIDCLETE